MYTSYSRSPITAEVPDKVRRTPDRPRSFRRVLRQGQQGSTPAHGFALLFNQLYSLASTMGYAFSNAHCGEVLQGKLRLQPPVHHPMERQRHVHSTPRKRQMRKARIHSALGNRRLQRDLAPAIERNLGKGCLNQTLTGLQEVVIFRFHPVLHRVGFLGLMGRLRPLTYVYSALLQILHLRKVVKHVQVLVRDNNVDQALRALKKKMQREGIFREMKLRQAYEKPSEKKAREKAEAIRRARKLARKKAQREGLL